MEIICIVDVFDFCWVNFLFQSSEVIFIVFACILGLISFFWSVCHSFAILVVNRFASCFGETLSIKVL